MHSHHQLPGNGQAESAASRGAMHIALQADKAFENFLLFVGRHAKAMIDDVDAYHGWLLLLDGRDYADGRFPWGVAQGIGKEIAKNLLQARLVGPDDDRVGNVDGDLAPLLENDRFKQIDNGYTDLFECKRSVDQRGGFELDATGIHDVGLQEFQFIAGAARFIEKFPARFCVEILHLAQQFQVALHDGQWCTQFMAGGGQESVFKMIELTHFRVRLAQFSVHASVLTRSGCLLVQVTQQAWVGRANQTDNQRKNCAYADIERPLGGYPRRK